MMSCDEAKRRWHKQLDDGRQDGQLPEHLARCASCAQYAAQMQVILCGLDELRIQSELDPADGAWDGRAAAHGRRSRWFRPLAVGRAAAVIALCVGVYFWLTPGGVRRPFDSGVAESGIARSRSDQSGMAQSGMAQSGMAQSGIGTTHGAAHVHAGAAGRDGWSQTTTLGLTLRGESATRFLAVAQPTTSPDIQMIRLYETPVASKPDSD